MCERVFALRQLESGQILAIEVEQVEGISDDAIAPPASSQGRLKRFETALPLFVENDSLHVEDGIGRLETAKS